MKDVRVPEQLMRAMAAEAEAAREARAKIIAAEGEERASTSLRNAANIISENKGALQVGSVPSNQNKNSMQIPNEFAWLQQNTFCNVAIFS